MVDATRTEEVGQRAIAAYKGIKGAIQLALAFVLGLATLLGARVNASGEIAAVLTPENVGVTSAFLMFDGTLTSIEGWALRRNRSWGPWLVVIATSGFIPLEIVAIARHPSFVRIAMLVINVAIVAFLVWKTLHHRRSVRRTMTVQ